MRKLDIVLAGFNGYGQLYADVLINNTYNLQYNFAAVVDPYLTEENKSSLTNLKIMIFDDLETFFVNHKADLTVIAAPIHLHKPMCETAVKNGSDVLCEKPATARLCDIYEMREYEKKYNKDIFIGFQQLFSEPIIELKKDFLSGKYGKIISCKTIVLWSRGLDYYNRTTGWAGKIKTANGEYIYDSVASNATAHYLSNLLFLLGDDMSSSVGINEIKADCFKANPIETFDTCVIEAKTEKEQDILFIASHAAENNIQPVFEIVCEKAVISCDFTQNNGMLTAKLPDGQEKNYGEINTTYQHDKKIIDVINWLNGSPNAEKPFSTVETSIPFTKAIDYLFENAEFKKFDKDIVFDEANNRYYVKDLSDKLYEIYKNH